MKTSSFTSWLCHTSGYLHLPSRQMVFFFPLFHHNFVHLFGFCMQYWQVRQPVIHTAQSCYSSSVFTCPDTIYVKITQCYCNLAQEILSSLTRLFVCVYVCIIPVLNKQIPIQFRPCSSTAGVSWRPKSVLWLKYSTFMRCLLYLRPQWQSSEKPVLLLPTPALTPQTSSSYNNDWSVIFPREQLQLIYVGVRF